MTNETRTPEEIERQIERDRANLTSNIRTLQDRISIDGIVGQVSDQLREHGGELGRSIARTVKENPAAVALTGVGLAWMIFGGKSNGSKDRERFEDYERSYDRGAAAFVSDRDPTMRHRSVSRPDPRFKGGEAGLPSWAREDDDDDGSGIGDRVSDAASSARDAVSGAGQSVRDGASNAGAAVSSKASDAKSAVSNTASSAAGSAKDMAKAAQDRAARLKERLAEGTETLSQEARTRVIAAREAAVDARRKASRALSHRAEQASDLYDQQPLVAGALAVAIGAAIGGALPRTRKEDELLGEHSDALMQEAERVFHDEVDKAKQVAAAAAKEAKTIAKETRDDLNRGAPGDKTAVEAVVDEAKSAGERVADAAKSKADEKGLGKVST